MRDGGNRRVRWKAVTGLLTARWQVGEGGGRSRTRISVSRETGEMEGRGRREEG